MLSGSVKLVTPWQETVCSLIRDRTQTGTHAFPVGPVEDQAVLGDLTRLGRPLDLQGLAGGSRAAQQGRAVQGHVLIGREEEFWL